MKVREYVLDFFGIKYGEYKRSSFLKNSQRVAVLVAKKFDIVNFIYKYTP